ncbi:GDP-mannose 4,6-dehydratase [Rhizobium sp. BK060]|uniref:NAD-dependent epimerase/dehydratase family protein n=1 Tax=Rhizobium sp. BK060 TaxID=2587096 RepID=UPI001612A882|nr:GDP-mannose 4,6-dehydratase [Rhizobium sp. BK060]MBB3397897.1 GDP-4-dehydro-6-deoxy-D-mannose reductase [Rhizobium sp. BK060]
MLREDRILITGANGFVGTWLQREFKRRQIQDGRNLTVIAVGHGSGADRATDITDRGQVADLIEECRPTAVIHLAAVAAPAEARRLPRRAWDVNFQGTMNLAYATIEHSPDARFIFVGSSEAYGASFIDAAGEAVREDRPLKPMTVYGATKAAADIAVAQLAYEGLKAICFRPFNHTGPGQTDAYVAAAFARQLAEIGAGTRPPRMEVGNLSALRDFLDVRDIVRAYTDAALMEVPPDALGKAFNLSSARPIQIQSILDMLIDLSGLKVDVEIDPKRLRGPEVAVASGDNQAAFKTFGWKPEIPLGSTLSDVLEDWKARKKPQ